MRRRIGLSIAAFAIAVATVWGAGGSTAGAKVSPKTSPSPGGRVLHK
jgi:hypothetical protein